MLEFNDIFGACTAVHGHLSGSGDFLSDSEYGKIVKYLKTKLNVWEPSRISKFADYEAAVKQLIVVTLQEHYELSDYGIIY